MKMQMSAASRKPKLSLKRKAQDDSAMSSKKNSTKSVLSDDNSRTADSIQFQNPSHRPDQTSRLQTVQDQRHFDRTDKFRVARSRCRLDDSRTCHKETIGQSRNHHQTKSLIRDVGNKFEDLVQLVQPPQDVDELFKSPLREIESYQPVAKETGRKGTSQGETLGTESKTKEKETERKRTSPRETSDNETDQAKTRRKYDRATDRLPRPSYDYISEHSHRGRKRNSICPVGSCSFMARKIKSHVIHEHLSCMFDTQFEKKMMNDFNFHRFRGHMVMVLARWFCKSNAATADDLITFLRRESYIPSSCSIDRVEIAWLRHVEYVIGGPLLRSYNIGCVNSPVCILHWRVMASVLHHLTIDQQRMVRMDVYNRHNPVQKERVNRMSVVFWGKESVKNLPSLPENINRDLQANLGGNLNGMKRETRSTQSKGSKSPAEAQLEILNPEELPIFRESDKNIRDMTLFTNDPRIKDPICKDFLEGAESHKTDDNVLKEVFNQEKGSVYPDLAVSQISTGVLPVFPTDPSTLIRYCGDLVRRPAQSNVPHNVPLELYKEDNGLNYHDPVISQSVSSSGDLPVIQKDPRVQKGFYGDLLRVQTQSKVSENVPMELYNQDNGVNYYEPVLSQSERSSGDLPVIQKDPRVQKGFYGDLIRVPAQGKVLDNMPLELYNQDRGLDYHDSVLSERRTRDSLLVQNDPRLLKGFYGDSVRVPVQGKVPDNLQLEPLNQDRGLDYHDSVPADRNTSFLFSDELVLRPPQSETESVYHGSLLPERSNSNFNNLTVDSKEERLSDASVLKPAQSEALALLLREMLNPDKESGLSFHEKPKIMFHLSYGQCKCLVSANSVTELKEIARKRFKLSGEIELMVGKSILDESVGLELLEPLTHIRVNTP